MCVFLGVFVRDASADDSQQDLQHTQSLPLSEREREKERGASEDNGKWMKVHV